jgi:multidrug efflux pump subunit AcrA (membrane-fusion protein)
MSVRAAIMLALLGAACARAEPVAEAPQPADELTPEAPRTLRVEPARGRSWLEAPAVAIAPATASAALGMPLTGRVTRVRVRLGQHVERNQPLIDVAMPELIRAAAAIEAADLRQRAYSERLAHLQTLAASGLARGSELSEARAQLALVQADKASARASLRAAGVTDVSGLEDGVAALRAPIAGTVVTLDARVGEVREPVGRPLLELAADAPVQIEVRFAYPPPASARFAWVASSGPIPLVLEAVSPRVNAADGTWSAWLHEVEGSAIAAGSASLVRIEAPADAVVFPSSALDPTQHVTRAGARVPVQVFMRGQGEVIATGLAAGDEIESRTP